LSAQSRRICVHAGIAVILRRTAAGSPRAEGPAGEDASWPPSDGGLAVTRFLRSSASFLAPACRRVRRAASPLERYEIFQAPQNRALAAHVELHLASGREHDLALLPATCEMSGVPRQAPSGYPGEPAGPAVAPVRSVRVPSPCRDFFVRSFSQVIPRIISPSYITVILGCPSRPPAVTHMIIDKEKGSGPMADCPISDDGKRVS
jgi:hypothetical protein